MKKQPKNYIGFVNDHSGSMATLHTAAMNDYNSIITATKNAASAEMLDTVVSVVGIGYPSGFGVARQVVISNPHVLKPIENWSTDGGTPLYDGIGDIIDLYSNLPDSKDTNVSFLIMVTTDGEEAHSKKHTFQSITALIKEKQALGNWTFVFRIPKGATDRVSSLGVPLDNIQEWETTSQGMAQSTTTNTAAMTGYFRSRAGGASASSSFYADATKVNVAALTEINPKDVSLYVVPAEDNGIQIQSFILRHRQKYLKGAAFYQLTKTESRVGPEKQILIRDRQTGKFFGGKEARQMLGLPSNQNTRLHPGDHGNFDLFIQSESINRKLVGGTGVAYMAKLGTEFTQAEIDLYTKPKATVVTKPAVVVLPKVAPTNKPTKSPIPVTPRTHYFETREDARSFCRNEGVSQTLIVNDKGAAKGCRWSVTKPTKK
jgi:hypothetical protein